MTPLGTEGMDAHREGPPDFAMPPVGPPPVPTTVPSLPPPTPRAPQPDRRPRWLRALGVIAICAAFTVFSGGFQMARATWRFEQAPPGMAYGRDGSSVRVLSIVATREAKSTAKNVVAPAGSMFVVARLEVVGDGEVFLCTGSLVLTDGRFIPQSAAVVSPEAGACSKLGKQPSVEMSLYYLVAESSLDRVAGIAVERRTGLARTTVLRPPA